MWNKSQENVANYVAGCIMCQKVKADRHSRQTKLVRIPTANRTFVKIAIDLVVELPESEGFNAILIMADQFSKLQHYISAKTTWIAGDVANVYINEIWRLYKLLRHITSHCSLQFASKFKFLRKRNRKLEIIHHLSTAYHTQTNVLNERVVQTWKQYSCVYCYDRQSG